MSIECIRLHRGPAIFVGARFALIALQFVGLAARNFHGYLSLRQVELRVLGSSLKIDKFPVEDQDSTFQLGNLLRIDSKVTDLPSRYIHWEIEADKAGYPEEVLVELGALAALLLAFSLG